MPHPKPGLWADRWPAFSLQPYFQRNIYTNYNHGRGFAYWLWSENADMIPLIIKHRNPDYVGIQRAPDMFVLSLKWHNQLVFFESLANATAAGEGPFRLVEFCEGKVVWKDRVAEEDSYAIFRKDKAAVSQPAGPAAGGQ